jgi:hypothetical protein
MLRRFTLHGSRTGPSGDRVGRSVDVLEILWRDLVDEDPGLTKNLGGNLSEDRRRRQMSTVRSTRTFRGLHVAGLLFCLWYFGPFLDSGDDRPSQIDDGDASFNSAQLASRPWPAFGGTAW